MECLPPKTFGKSPSKAKQLTQPEKKRAERHGGVFPNLFSRGPHKEPGMCLCQGPCSCRGPESGPGFWDRGAVTLQAPWAGEEAPRDIGAGGTSSKCPRTTRPSPFAASQPSRREFGAAIPLRRGSRGKEIGYETRLKF